MNKLKIEAVAITQAGLSNHLNGENFNLNGRVLTSADADRGYKGAGNLTSPLVLSICSGKAETRSATIAMKVLSSHIEEIKMAREDYELAINRYFDNARRDVSLVANDYAEISSTLLYAYENNLVIAGLGDGRCFRVLDNTIETISSPQELLEAEIVTPYYHTIENLVADEYYLLCTAGLYEFVTESEIATIIKGSSNSKQAAQKLLDSAKQNGSQKDITLILITASPYFEDYEAYPYPAEGLSAANDHTHAYTQSNNADPYSYDSDYDYQEDYQEEPAISNKIPLIILSVLLVVFLALVGLYIAKWKKEKDANLDLTETTDNEMLLDETELDTSDDPTITEEATEDLATNADETETQEESTTTPTTVTTTTNPPQNTTTTTSPQTTTTTPSGQPDDPEEPAPEEPEEPTPSQEPEESSSPTPSEEPSTPSFG